MLPLLQDDNKLGFSSPHYRERPSPWSAKTEREPPPKIEPYMKKLIAHCKRATAKLFPTRGMQAIAWGLAGAFVGLSAYLVYISKAYSYLSDDPEVCINCHVMGPYYATWQHSSHAGNATCTDCHVPHTSLWAKYLFKAQDGLRHSTVFTLRTEPQRMQAIPEAQAVIYENCVRCHSQLNQEFVHAGHLTAQDIKQGDERACWDCHRDVPHMGKTSLSATPDAIIPYPKSPVPTWLKEQIQGRSV